MKIHPILSAALSPLSLIYRTGLFLRCRGYELGLLKKRKLPVPVISVGNLSLGGTGKTPCAMYLAMEAKKRGFRPAIVTRGYGGKARGTVVVSDGENVLLGPEMAGDEAHLMGRSASGVPVIKSPDRYRGGLLALERFDSNLFILDDGFQHIRLERDVDVVLISASISLGSERLFPAGRLREPLSALGRGHEIVLTKAGPGDGDRRITELESHGIGRPVSLMDYEPAELVDSAGRVFALETLGGKRVYAFAGIAAPGHFRRFLVDAGADVVEFVSFGDHHSYTAGELEAIKTKASAAGADMLISTEKDMVKLKGRAGEGVLALRVRVSLEDHVLDRIFSAIAADD